MLTHKQAQDNLDEIFGLLENELLPKDFNKVINFYLGISEAHCSGRKWTTQFLDKNYDLITMLLDLVHENKDFHTVFFKELELQLVKNLRN